MTKKEFLIAVANDVPLYVNNKLVTYIGEIDLVDSTLAVFCRTDSDGEWKPFDAFTTAPPISDFGTGKYTLEFVGGKLRRVAYDKDQYTDPAEVSSVDDWLTNGYAIDYICFPAEFKFLFKEMAEKIGATL